MSTPGDTRISDDLRYELADAARAAAASNRPRSLLVLATLLFVAAGLVLIVTLRQRDEAAQQHRIQADREVLVEGLALQFAALESLGNSTQNRANEPLDDLFSRIEAAAAAAGLADQPTIPQPTRQSIQGAIKLTYRYTMRDPSLENLLAWVEGARSEVPGLEISSIDLTPGPKDWKLEVTFVRWERAS